MIMIQDTERVEIEMKVFDISLNVHGVLCLSYEKDLRTHQEV